MKISKTMFAMFVFSTLLFMSACEPSQNNRNTSGSNDNNLETKEKGEDTMKDELVSADKFMEYYGISESEVPKEYVAEYIHEYGYKEDSLAKWDLGSDVKTEYANGVKYGLDPYKIFRGDTSSLPLEEFIVNADVVQFDFDMRYGSELSSQRVMTLDLKNKKAYFTGNLGFDYTVAEKNADLTDDDVKLIRENLPKHIVENSDASIKDISKNYSFRIKMKANDYSTKFYRGEFGEEERFPGFDEYWIKLYKKCFNEEFVFEM